MRAKIKIEKSFDESKEFSKDWQNGDFCEFMKEEGDYLDRLSKSCENRPETGKLFTVTYTVTLER